MALVLFEENENPRLFLIPSCSWLVDNKLFRNREYKNLKSKPEWGLNISKSNIDLLSIYNVEKAISNYIF